MNIETTNDKPRNKTNSAREWIKTAAIGGIGAWIGVTAAANKEKTNIAPAAGPVPQLVIKEDAAPVKQPAEVPSRRSDSAHSSLQTESLPSLKSLDNNYTAPQALTPIKTPIQFIWNNPATDRPEVLRSVHIDRCQQEFIPDGSNFDTKMAPTYTPEPDFPLRELAKPLTDSNDNTLPSFITGYSTEAGVEHVEITALKHSPGILKRAREIVAQETNLTVSDGASTEARVIPYPWLHARVAVYDRLTSHLIAVGETSSIRNLDEAKVTLDLSPEALKELRFAHKNGSLAFEWIYSSRQAAVRYANARHAARQDVFEQIQSNMGSAKNPNEVLITQLDKTDVMRRIHGQVRAIIEGNDEAKMRDATALLDGVSTQRLFDSEKTVDISSLNDTQRKALAEHLRPLLKEIQERNQNVQMSGTTKEKGETKTVNFGAFVIGAYYVLAGANVNYQVTNQDLERISSQTGIVFETSTKSFEAQPHELRVCSLNKTQLLAALDQTYSIIQRTIDKPYLQTGAIPSFFSEQLAEKLLRNQPTLGNVGVSLSDSKYQALLENLTSHHKALAERDQIIAGLGERMQAIETELKAAAYDRDRFNAEANKFRAEKRQLREENESLQSRVRELEERLKQEEGQFKLPVPPLPPLPSGFPIGGGKGINPSLSGPTVELPGGIPFPDVIKLPKPRDFIPKAPELVPLPVAPFKVPNLPAPPQIPLPEPRDFVPKNVPLPPVLGDLIKRRK